MQEIKHFFNTDSAAACKLAGRALEARVKSLGVPNVALVHTKCQTHHVVNAMVDLLRLCKVMNGIYCTLLQMHKHKTLRSFRFAIRQRLRKELHVTYVEGPGGKDFAEAVVDLLHLGDHDTNAEGNALQKRWSALSEVLHSWEEGQMVAELIVPTDKSN